MQQAGEVGRQMDVLLRVLQERWGQCGPYLQVLNQKHFATGNLIVSFCGATVLQAVWYPFTCQTFAKQVVFPIAEKCRVKWGGTLSREF